MAGYTKIKVVAVLYRLAPESPFPAAVDDSIAVYKELLKTHRPAKIGIYGTSAGAILTAETAARLKQLGLPLPAALGFFSGMADFSRIGDSSYYFGVPGLAGARVPRGDGAAGVAGYVAQLVQPGGPQHCPQRNQAGIIARVELGHGNFGFHQLVEVVAVQSAICVHLHRPEFEEGELAPLVSNTPLAEQDRPAGSASHH